MAFKKGNKPWNKGKRLSEKIKKKMRKARIGERNPMYGKKQTRQSRSKDREAMKKKWQDIEYRKKVSQSISKGMKGKKKSKEHRKHISDGHKGKKCYNWKGGITALGKQIRNCFKYRQWRSDIFTRDDFTCQKCGLRGVYLEAHHIKRFSKIIKEYNIRTLEQALLCEELWNINNGQTLCKECHNKLHKIL